MPGVRCAIGGRQRILPCLRPATGSRDANLFRFESTSELRFEHYTVLQNAEGKPFELGHGGMGVTYKASDVHLQCPVALKIINAQLFGNESARLRFVREARAAASVRHQNVASVFHIGESGGNSCRRSDQNRPVRVGLKPATFSV
jgi:hypothetical protein